MSRRMQAKAIDAARKLINALRDHGEQSMVELGVALNYSSSGTRKHVTRLERSGIVSRSSVPILGGPTGGMMVRVKLRASDEQIAEYLVSMETSSAPMREQKVKPSNFAIGTMVHEMMDDLGMRIRKNTTVKVQRHWMDVALFGPAEQRGAP